ncbi:uncharacterized protein BYT42DRAFT_564785 [Radiomyces spectabilis]|uniref:uncharacterized protein n=1 Tax=Radiomyces spectabilis TaxID=64574 RepID=UPI002220FD6F|nr:uncharacterized protein BYT42DRAFT_564785 [Radiomyces spectabilis]KAI8380962.1 hypothetical protein BYT42DRAFT_564785 [Radiomyces spectabilis]
MYLLRFLFLVTLGALMATAQMGPEITNPKRNATINAGEKINIDFEYQNLGTGEYSVDISLWLDPSFETLLQNITTNHEIDSGNSTGVHLDMTQNATYEWKVPHGLNDTVYLTVTEYVQTTAFKNLRVHSAPVMLHFSAGTIHLPTHHVGLLLLGLVIFVFSSL